MVRKLLRDESGMTMGLVVIMIVLIGVMGAGLLTFVATDLNSVVEVNRGQRAFEMADAGIKAAEKQLEADGNAAHYDSPDVASDNLAWAVDPGKNLSMDGSTAKVRITSLGSGAFKVLSTGESEPAKRVIEVVFKERSTANITIPPSYFTQRNLTFTGNVTLNGVSIFALGDVAASGSVSVENTPDRAYGKWAETADTYSYPNPFNLTPRSDYKAGIAARGKLCVGGTSAINALQRGIRSFGGTYYGIAGSNPPTCSTTVVPNTWPRVVPDYSASPLSPSQKIAFPFDTGESSGDLEVLRQRAIDLEAQTGFDYYKQNLSGEQKITSWPSGSDYETVMFYSFNSYSSANRVLWDINALCSNTTRKGVIVVENGDFRIAGNRSGFNGAIIVRGGSGDNQGTFTSEGGSCINGYANSRGNMYIAGTFNGSDVPILASLPAFNTRNMQTQSWRERYE